MRTFIGLTAIALALAACGGKGPGTTPEATFEVAQSAIKAEDYGAFYDLQSPAARKAADEEFKKLKENKGMAAMALSGMGIKKEELDKCDSARDFTGVMFRHILEKNPEKLKELTDSKIVDKKVDGDKATLKIKTGDKTDTMHMVRIDGKWYMAQDMR